jgi:hypothetical protein
MTLPVEIEGTSVLGGSRNSVTAVNRDRAVGLVTYTEPLHIYRQRYGQFINSEYGKDMSVDASEGGATEVIHDGLDTVAWTGSNITGAKVTFNSTDAGRFSDGVASVKIDNPNQNDTWEFNKGSVVDLTAYDGLHGHVNIDKDWAGGDSVSVYAYNTATSSVVGTPVSLEDYINQASYDVGQTFSIPLEDMSLSINSADFDCFRMTQEAKQGKAAKWYLDGFKLVESGSITYSIDPPVGKVVSYQRLEVSLADNVTSLSYFQLLGVSGAKFGISRIVEGKVTDSVLYGSIGDMISGGWTISDTFTDGTTTFIKLILELPEPSVLDQKRGDKVRLTLSGNFSSLLSFSAIAVGREYVGLGDDVHD